MAEWHHSLLHSRCGACGLYFHVDDLFYSCEKHQTLNSSVMCSNHRANLIPVVVRREGSVVTGHGPSEFPFHRYHVLCDDVWLCYHPGCHQHHAETVVAHADCLKLFCRNTGSCGINDKLHWLWVAATWTSPWHETLELHVRPQLDFDRRVADLGLTKQLIRLPEELNVMIRDFSLQEDSQLGFALLHDYELRTASSPFLMKAAACREPLAQINIWSRGEIPDIQTTINKPFVRLSFD